MPNRLVFVMHRTHTHTPAMLKVWMGYLGVEGQVAKLWPPHVHGVKAVIRTNALIVYAAIIAVTVTY